MLEDVALVVDKLREWFGDPGVDSVSADRSIRGCAPCRRTAVRRLP